MQGEHEITFEDLPLDAYQAGGKTFMGAFLREATVTFDFEVDEFGDFERLEVSAIAWPAYADGDYRNPVQACIRRNEPLFALIAAAALRDRDFVEQEIIDKACSEVSFRDVNAEHAADYRASVL